VHRVYTKDMVIAVVAKKGGVGKSLVSLLLFESLRQAGRSVDLHDWDAQGTTTKSRELIDAGRVTEPGADITIYDTPPNLAHTATDTAIRSADLVLIVTTPSPVDVWEAQDAAQLTRKSAKRKAKVLVLFNKVRRTTVLGRVLEETAKQIPVPMLPTVLSSRECYQHFVWQGWKALDGAAREEVLQLTIAVLGLQ
jgi:cellulose biosynthesis protein BcsQ